MVKTGVATKAQVIKGDDTLTNDGAEVVTVDDTIGERLRRVDKAGKITVDGARVGGGGGACRLGRGSSGLGG